MGNALLTWELGGGLGHLVNLRPFAELLCQRGHRVFAALKDLSQAPQVFRNAPVEYLQAPIKTRRSSGLGASVTFAHILYGIGFCDDRELCTLTDAWRQLYDHVRPDLIVFDHSPTALLAARTCDARLALVGTGFFAPPREYPLPVLQTKSRLTRIQLTDDEHVVLDRANRVLLSWGSPPLECLADMYADVDENFLATFKELDHYPARRAATYWGAWPAGVGAPPAWPQGPSPRIFVYLKPVAALPAVLQAIAGIRGSKLIYVDGLPPEHVRQFTLPTMRIVSAPVELSAAARDCDVAVLNGNHGTTVAMLLAGKPTVQLPIFLEQLLFSQAVERLGAGVISSLDDAADVALKIETVCTTAKYSNSAKLFAARYANVDPRNQIERMIERAEELIRSPSSDHKAITDNREARPEPNPPASIARTFVADPKTFVCSRRFDVLAKCLYARHILNSETSEAARLLYLEHLRILNDFWETFPRKRTGDDFLTAFESLLAFVRTSGHEGLPPVSVGRDGVLVEGAHRVAACAIYGLPVRCVEVDRPGLELTASWFRRRSAWATTGLSTQHADQMAAEFCRLKPDARIFLFLPGLAANRKKIVSFLKQHGDVIYGKKISLTSPSRIRLKKEIPSLPSEWAERGASNDQPVHVCLFDGDLDIETLWKKLLVSYGSAMESVYTAVEATQHLRLVALIFGDSPGTAASRQQPGR